MAYYVLSAKLARQISEKYGNASGWFVLDTSGRIVYHMQTAADARKACRRLNLADHKARTVER